ncbi:phospholipid phosphatase homolog 1.2 homolog isoform X2 [Phlebotomus argentipes]|uniref:phospholipid phosphatase homolog 1.2 homolog isoform X2 n=1 Tax=Phlebotomus argentipes TaxID=94469 RepID=UPI002892B6A8|nr:phospholipid phosphatase homolog 1.2 homolog isoform X2 [Phlebotomus argentipes]XP_059609428.1 phospholipid phosphatase homolog 1.2 homolog isoform X2 [Phlebotomus argentipes]
MLSPSIAVDIIICFLFAAWFAVIECGWFPHKQREFQCKDPSLSFKYNGDTITAAVIVLSTFIPFFILWVTEAFYAKPTNLKLSRTRTSLKKAYYWFKKYYIGVIMNLAIVETLKVIVGGLRPHFFYSCRPDVMDVCQPGEIIFRYTCKNTVDSLAFVRDSQKSFPSGHSSLAFFEAIFLIWYFQKRIPKLRCMLLMPLIYTLCISWACFASVSRMTDHRHHWFDVLAGVILGIILAYFTCKVMCNNFRGCRNNTNSDVASQNGVLAKNSLKDREETTLSTNLSAV